ncbi:Fur family transcriptional regulator [Kineosporia sp. R_H_3]|uniref:Fur family transcriptional regulator n=1 Tax=Kineosporia sp. R_H_3 TaxID=1961848 RepID=UPI001179E404|nr:transcriptional repressor [Kineosporia sp. R_H_3]
MRTPPATTDASARREELRALGRVTGSRLLVLEALEASPANHLTAQQIHEALGALGYRSTLSTVYRTVTWLLDAGLVHEVVDGQGARWGARARAHHHLVCSRCGTTTDAADSDAVDDSVADLSSLAGWGPPTGRLAITALCPPCNSGGTSASSTPAT